MSEQLKDLVRSARNGDREAYGALYERFERSVHRVCHALLDDPEAADDATQETFVRVWERMSGLRHPEAFSAFLRGAAVQVCRDRRRRTRWLSFWSELGGETEPLEPADPEPGAGAALETGELSAAVRAAMRRLAPDHREVIVLHHLEELPVADIALTLGVAEGTVKSRLSRARAHLERLLRPYVED